MEIEQWADQQDREWTTPILDHAASILSHLELDIHMESAIEQVHAKDSMPDLVLKTGTPLICHVELLAITRPDGCHLDQKT